jgi:hypothetical protein
MAKAWEIRGLFGNEYALEGAMEMLKSQKGVEFEKLDRRNLSVRLGRRDRRTEDAVKRTIDIFHGFVEAEGPVGEFDKKKEAERQAKVKAYEEKAKRLAKH